MYSVKTIQLHFHAMKQDRRNNILSWTQASPIQETEPMFDQLTYWNYRYKSSQVTTRQRQCIILIVLRALVIPFPLLLEPTNP